MRFIPAVSGVQIPPLLPEYDRKPGNFPGFFCYGLFCRVSRDAGQRPARPAGPSWKGRATGDGMSRPGSPAGGLPHTAIVRGLLRSRDGKSPEPFRQEKQPRPRSFRPGPLREFFSLPGENTEKACQRRASSVDASLRCGKSTKPYGKVAQLVRACGSYPQCRGFKSLPCYQKFTSGSGLSRTAFLLWLYL